MVFEMTDEGKAKEALFQRCYGLIQQDRIPVAAVALSGLDAFILKEFFDFCNIRDQETGKDSGETVQRFFSVIAENL